MHARTERRRPRAVSNTGSAGPVFPAFLAVVLAAVLPMVPCGARAQEPMPLSSPLKPVHAAADSVPLPVLHDPSAAGFEELIVDLRAGQESTHSAFAFARNGRMWVPALPVFDLMEMKAAVDSTGVLSSMLDPDRLGLNVYPRAREVWRGNYYRLTHEGDVFFFDGEMYVATADLAWVLDVQVFEDFTDMTVIFDGIGHLPLGRRLHRERMRRLDDLYAAEPDVVYEAERAPWSGATVDWGLSTASVEEFERTNYDLGFGGALFGGAMDARYRATLDGSGPDQFDARWQGVWPQQTWLRQLELGGTRATGPRGRPIDGISLGNSPFLRSSEFGQTVLRGQVEPNWEVEIYRDGRLLAWDRVDDRGVWEFVVPLDYGQNPVEVRAYGPNGEVQITERAVRVDFDRIPARTLEYGLSAGRTEYREANFATNADLRYGLNRNWTARAGYEGYGLESGGDTHHPYLALTGSVREPLRVGAERVVDAWWWAAASLERSSRFRIGLEHYRYDRQGASEVLVNPGELQRSALDLFWRPWRERRGVFFEFDVEQVQRIYDRRTDTALGATTLIHSVRTSAQLKESFDRTDVLTSRRSAIAAQASYVLRSDGHPWWHGTQLRLQSELDTGHGINDWVQLSLGRRIGRNARIEIGGGWYRLTDSAQFTIGVSSTGTHAYMNAWMTGRDRGGATTRLSAEGSLLYNPERGNVETYPFRSLGRGGLSGTVFVDANGNGRLDSGEQTVPGARLIAGNLIAETDEFGRYSIWNLVPFEAADLLVESASLPNPTWVPAFDLAAAAVAPNGFRNIDLPLVEAVEVEGLIRTRDGDALHRAGAVPLKLVQVDGRREHQTRCFSDGEFYLMGVVPGSYRVEIEEGWLQARGLMVSADTTTLVMVGAGSDVTRFELVLEPAQ